MTKYAMDRARETWTELTLCDPCVRQVFAFAQGQPAPEEART